MKHSLEDRIIYFFQAQKLEEPASSLAVRVAEAAGLNAKVSERARCFASAWHGGVPLKMDALLQQKSFRAVREALSLYE